MNHSNARLLLRSIAVLLLLSFYNISYAQDESVPVEPSEKWLNSQHKPVELMDAIGLKEGMTIADIGAGRGRMTVFFASRVGKKGLVLANEINKKPLEHLENRCKKHNINNVKTYLGTVVDPMLPEGMADIVFLVSTFHHLEKPVELMRNALPALRPDGRLVIVERDPIKTGQTNSESTSQAVIISQMKEAGYAHVKTNTELLERDNIYYFKVGN
jgi:ubiquinone/menaquinone biosynthesis C-methylase UbiE